jgi:hypothetical protein
MEAALSCAAANQDAIQTYIESPTTRVSGILTVLKAFDETEHCVFALLFFPFTNSFAFFQNYLSDLFVADYLRVLGALLYILRGQAIGGVYRM